MEEFLYKDEGYKIIGCFYAVYNTFGSGFLGSVYQEALAKEFVQNKIPFVREQKLEIYYKEDKLKKYFRADFICYNDILVEVLLSFVGYRIISVNQCNQWTYLVTIDK